MANTSKPVASFQNDQGVRKKILNLIKRKMPESESENAEDSEVQRKCSKSKHHEKVYLFDKSENSEHGRVQCSTCGQMYNSPQLLDKHVRRVHLKEKPHKCQHCDYRAFYKREVFIHEQRTHIRNKSFKCPHCDYLTTDNLSLYSHLTTHSKTKALRCDQCPYSCSWRKQLTRHAEAHSAPSRVTCQVCGIVSRDKKQDLVHYSIEHAVVTTTTKKRTVKPAVTTATCANEACIDSTTAVSVSAATPTSSSASKVLLSDDSVGLSLAQLLTRNESPSSSVLPPPDNNPKLVISKDEVTDNIRVLNVTDLVRRHVRREANPLQLRGKQTIVEPAPPRAKQVSLLKSALRSDVKRILQEASSAKTHREVVAEKPSDAEPTSAAEVKLSESSDTPREVLEVDFPHDVVDSIASEEEIQPQPVPSELIIDSLTVNFDERATPFNINDTSAKFDHSLQSQVTSGTSLKNFDLSDLDLDTQLGSDFLNDTSAGSTLSSVNSELYGLLEMFEQEEASRRQEAGSGTQVKLNRADLSEIIGLIEHKINSDDVCPPALECAASCDSQSQAEPVQVVLQVNNPSESDGQPLEQANSAVSIELTHLDQILRSLLFNPNSVEAS